MYEDTLLEKLHYLLETKNEILQAIKDIGNNEITEYTLLRDYPDEIRRVHSDIIDVCRYLRFADEGGDVNTVLTEDPSTQDTMPYIRNILLSKNKLAENLMMRGVSAENTEAFMTLAEKVALIEDATTAVAQARLSIGNRLDEINGEEIL